MTRVELRELVVEWKPYDLKFLDNEDVWHEFKRFDDFSLL